MHNLNVWQRSHCLKYLWWWKFLDCQLKFKIIQSVHILYLKQNKLKCIFLNFISYFEFYYMLCTQLTVMQSHTCTKGKCHCILTCIFLPSPYHSVTPHNGGLLLKNQTQGFFLLKWQLQSIVLEATTGVRHYASLVLQPVAKTISHYTFCVCVCEARAHTRDHTHTLITLLPANKATHLSYSTNTLLHMQRD